MEEEILLSGIFRLDVSCRLAYVKGRKLRLRNKEFLLLEYFLKNVGRVISRTQLLEDVWDRNICCATNTVDVHVSSLRQKIRSTSRFDCIKTIYCVGYVFKTLSKDMLKNA
ncbi:winged helix-turn-helix transcriptional regulator [Candidatus Peregrinibacteria bacterium]|nr:winged helix-turn-helix transcriptional regulator [Candidatus Peregrinibacteria bacterium]